MSDPTRPTTPPGVSLRRWLAHLAETDRLVAADGKALRFEVAACAKAVEREKAVLFRKPDGHPVPVVANLFAARGWIAEAMGVSEADLTERFLAASEAPIPSRTIEDAPLREVMVTTDIDLNAALPIPTHNEHDSGPYVTAGLLIVRDPETGAQNVSIHRCQITGPDRIGILLLPRHAYRLHKQAEEAGAALPVAIVIGADPLTILASQAIAPMGQDELEIAGALHGAPLEVVRCQTSDIEVPANAEIVIEGRLLSNIREPEGPFGEFPQYYGPRSDSQVVEVTALTHRRHPIFHTITGGNLEHLLLGGIPREATLLSHLRRSFPGVQAVHLPIGGVCRYHLVVQLSKRGEGEAKNVILGAFAGHYDIKQVTVVDPDVDPFDADAVAWAVATRFQADRDLVRIDHAQGSKLDPSAREGVSAKLGFDATAPLDADEMAYKRIHVPGMESVDRTALLAATVAASAIGGS
jgi:2,5-furandicarboxylate decarboxylase 1